MLLSYSESLQKCKLPITPKEYAVVFDAIPTGSLQFLKNCNTIESNFVSKHIFIGDVDIWNNPCSNRHIRNALEWVTPPAAEFFWSSIVSDLQWKKSCILNKYCIKNKVKEVSFKSWHRIYPLKEVLERLKLNIEYSCVFCNSDKETIFHLFFHCAHSNVFWTDILNFVNRKIWNNVQINVFDVMLYFVFHGLDKNANYIIQLLIILGKFHIHKSKWAGSKPCFNRFAVEFKQYGTLIECVKNKKATRPTLF